MMKPCLPNRDCFVKWGLRFVTSLILAGVLLCLYWMLIDRQLPITVDSGVVTLYQKQKDDSWVMVVRWHGKLNRRCGGVSKRWLIDGYRLPLADMPYPPEADSIEIGRDFTWEVPIHVPSYFVSTGHSSGYYRARFFYACNALQERIFPIMDNPPLVRFDIPVDAPPQHITPAPPQGTVTGPNY